MSDYNYGDYYSSLLTGAKPNNTELRKDYIINYIENGLSSVKIAKKLNVSYITILRKVDKDLSKYSKQLRLNGKQHMIRKTSDTIS